MQEDNLLKLAHLCLDRLRGDGVSIRATASISDFENRMVDLGMPPSHPMISHSWHDFSQSDAFALIISKGGKEVGGMAARRIGLGRDNLADHWAASYSRMYCNGEGAPVEDFNSVAVREITGDIVYLGQLFLVREQRNGPINLGLVLHYAHLLCCTKWRPDWIYGFIRQKDILRGKAAQYGFTRQYVGPQNWVSEVNGRSSNEYLVALTYDDLCDAAAFYTKNPDVFAPKRESSSSG